MHAKLLPSCPTPGTVAHHIPRSMGFSRQEYWSGLPVPPPAYLLDLGMQHRVPALQADSLSSEPPGKPKTVTEKVICFFTEAALPNYKF